MVGGGAESHLLLDKLGNPYTLVDPGVSIKPYPCGSLAHPSMDTLLELVLEHDVKPEDIEGFAWGPALTC